MLVTLKKNKRLIIGFLLWLFAVSTPLIFHYGGPIITVSGGIHTILIVLVLLGGRDIVMILMMYMKTPLANLVNSLITQASGLELFTCYWI